MRQRSPRPFGTCGWPRSSAPSATAGSSATSWPTARSPRSWPPRRPARRDCKFNGVTPENEETPVTDVTMGHDEAQPELSAADEQLLRELTERARTGGLQLT